MHLIALLYKEKVHEQFTILVCKSIEPFKLFTITNLLKTVIHIFEISIQNIYSVSIKLLKIIVSENINLLWFLKCHFSYLDYCCIYILNMSCAKTLSFTNTHKSTLKGRKFNPICAYFWVKIHIQSINEWMDVYLLLKNIWSITLNTPKNTIKKLFTYSNKSSHIASFIIKCCTYFSNQPR